MINESLQDYAASTSQTVASAYAAWHSAGKRIAAMWQSPYVGKRTDGIKDPHVTIASGRCLGLTDADVRRICK